LAALADWGEQEIAALLAVASPEIKLALVLALWTGQRQGDLLRMPWSAYDGSHLRFRRSASVSGLTFHDLGDSAVVRLALAEATVPQIATFTGHSLKDVEPILDARYLGRDVQLAEAAVLKLEKRTKL
jgi:integrase